MSGLGTAFGSGAMTNSIHELDEMGPKDAIFAIGTNTTECHPIIGLKMFKAKERGTKLVVADPRKTDMALHADVWLRLKPGTDVALLNGISNVILTEGLADEAFIAKRTENFEAFKAVAMKFTPEYTANITHVSAEKIQQAARIIAKADNTASYYTMGITQHTTGVDNVLSVTNLAMLTGNMGRSKTGVNPLRGQNNVQGACDMGALPNVYTGYQSVTNPDVKAKFEKAWNAQLSDKVGLTIPSILNAIAKDEVKMLYVFGENPMRSDPDINHVEHCLKHLDCLIVQDIFLTETAEIADVVLPGVSYAEKDGTFTSTDRTVQRIRKAIEPIGNSLPDWQILRDIMNAMGYPANYNSSEDVFDEMRSLTASYAGISYKRLEESRITWPCPNENHPGTPILHVGKFSRGLGKFSPIEYREPAELPDKEYPLMLTTGRVVAHYHTGSMTRRSWGLNGVEPEGFLEINPTDAKNLNIEDGDEISASTRRGSLITKAQVTTRVPEGLTFITFHFTESPGNILTNSAGDPVTETPELKVCSVKIKKLDFSDFGCQKRKIFRKKSMRKDA
ncbi:Formate dehydrogenase H [Clostridium ljungdahlii]|uniref:Formate dehydrogenase H n=1 Tax=Clostridium ljungdahlii TaxID=1538 RepID=A0A162N990_9CLOT|nr:Formate dehydrogenase H [Clostridium ljungdahlii]